MLIVGLISSQCCISYCNFFGKRFGTMAPRPLRARVAGFAGAVVTPLPTVIEAVKVMVAPSNIHHPIISATGTGLVCLIHFAHH